MPWMGYHFWMSTFTMVHHTAPHIPFKASDEWNAAQAQLGGTVHCNYPRWIEILCHYINVHISHHISPRIPSYNLKAAHRSLQENWGKYLNEANWNWRLMKTIITVCHVYDKEQCYVPFDEIKVESLYPEELNPDSMSTEDFLSSGLASLDRDIAERVTAACSKGNVLRYVCMIEGSSFQVGLQELRKDTPLGRLQGSDNVVEIYSKCYKESPLVIQGADILAQSQGSKTRREKRGSDVMVI